MELKQRFQLCNVQELIYRIVCLFSILFLFSLLVKEFFLGSILNAKEKKMDTYIQEIDELLNPFVQENLLSGNILITQGHKIIYDKSFGYADKTKNIRNSSETIFRIASVTKVFTSTAIFQLAERKLLSLEDPISKYIEEIPNGSEITIKQLLSHTSGLANYNSLVEVTSLDSLVCLIKSLKPVSNPGEKYAYCNSGYVLLTKVIEILSKMSYEDYLEKYIFQPASMNHSGIYKIRCTVEMASGYSKEPYGNIITAEDRNPFGKGDGAVYSTTGDLLKFSQAIQNNYLINSQSFKTATQVISDGYGCGWMIEKIDNLDSFYHYGGITGYMTGLRIIPEKNITIIFLFNKDNLLSYSIEQQIANIVSGKKYENIIKNLQDYRQEYQELSGEYDLGDSTSFKLFAQKEQLLFQETNKPVCKALIINKKTIYIPENNYRISFTKNEKGVWEYTAFLGLFLVTGEKIELENKD